MTTPDDARRYPLTAAQAGIWFGQQLDPTGRRFAVGGHLHIHGDLDVELFEHALRQTISGSETLRVCIAIEDAEPVQIPMDLDEWPLHRMDFADSPDPLGAAREFIDDHMDSPYDLTRAPLFDHTLIRLGDSEYLWFVRFHHIICDGGAMAAFTLRVSEAYRALRNGDPVPHEIFDALDAFVGEDTRYRASHRFESDREFWTSRLGVLPDAAQLTEDSRGGATDEFLRHSGHLDAAIWAALRERADAYGVQWPVLVLAATAIALHADSGRRDVVPGLTVPAKRSWHALGMTANVVPLRLAVDPAASLADLMGAVRSETMTVLRHQRYRLADIHRDLAAGRRQLIGPVVTIMAMDRVREFGGHPAVPHEGSPGHTDGVTIGVFDNGEPELRIDIDSVAARHTPQNLAAHHARLLNILTAIAHADPHTTIGQLRYSPAPQQLSNRVPVPANESAAQPIRHTPAPHTVRNRTTAPVQQEGDASAPQQGESTTILNLFATEMRKSVEQQQTSARSGAFHAISDEPETLLECFAHGMRLASKSAAIIFGPNRIGYPELDRKSDRLAARLIARGAGRGVLVAVLLPRSIDAIVAIVAVLKSGAAYVPMDAAAPSARQQDIVTGADPRLIVTTRAHSGTHPADRIVLIEDEDGSAATTPAPIAAPRPGDPAYVIHTSGSTGRPKGVVVTHECAARLLASTGSMFGFGPSDVWTLFHSTAFDFSVWEIWGALRHGATAVVVDEETTRSPDDFLDLLVAQQVTILNQTPAAFDLLTTSLTARAEIPDLALRLVIFGGDALDPRRLAGWYDRMGANGPQLVNMYGITETTVHVTAHPLSPAAVHTTTSPVGQPLPGREVLLLDTALRPAQPGLAAEIYVRGDGVALGYLGQPGATAARFVADPAGSPGQRMYRSGDLGRWCDGAVEYFGRADRQLKIRGFRIEPGEIEAALCALPGVTAARVRGEQYGAGDIRLIAYVVAPDGDSAELRAKLTNALPAHLIPSRIVPIDAMPLTPNGKVDDLALRRGIAEGARHPVGESAIGLYRVFGEVLGHSEFGVTDNFFTLGGDSLLANRLVIRLREELGVAVTLRDLFERPSVAELTEFITTAGRSAYSALPSAGPRPDRLPLSDAQFRLWTLYRLDPAAATYHIPIAFRVTGDLDHAALVRAATDVQARHESLRTVFAEDGDHVYQVVLDDPPNPVTTITTGEVSTARLDAEAARPFDLTRRPPWRLLVFRCGAAENVLLLVLHHIAADEHSLGPLAADLHTAYTARLDSRAPEWTPLPLQYADFALWQRDSLGDPDDPRSRLSADLGHWREVLRDSPSGPRLPTDRTSTAVTHRAGATPIEFDTDIHDRVASLATRRGATPFMVLHAAVACLLERIGAGTDIVLATVTSGRDAGPLDPLVGFFAETVLLRTDLTGSPGFGTVLDRVRDADLTAFAHSVPLGHIARSIRPERTTGPLFEVMVTLRRDRDLALTLPGLSCDPIPLTRTTAKFPLLFEFVWGTDTLTAILEYSTELFDLTTAETLAHDLRRLLTAVLADPDSPVEEIPLPGLERRGVPAAASPVPVDPDTHSHTEQLLLSLVESVLGVTGVGPQDGFFHLGGDSILAIRLVNRARSNGVLLTAKDVFERQTVRELARVAKPMVAGAADPLAGTGTVTPTPIMRDLLDNPTPTAGFGQYVAVPAPPGATEDSLRAALQSIVDRHDALRLQLTGDVLTVRPCGAVAAAPLLRRIATDDANARLPEVLDTTRERLSPRDGVMLQVAWLYGRNSLLLIMIHHLAVDGVAWRILLPELAAAHHAAVTGTRPELPPILTPLRTWTDRITALTVPDDEAAWWSRMTSGPAGLDTAAPDPARDTIEHTKTLTVTMDPASTEALLTRVPTRFHSTVAHVLLAALSVAAARDAAAQPWVGLLVDVEGHGRDVPTGTPSDLDVSSTLGWFTVIHPVRLEAAVQDWNAMVHNGSGLTTAAKQVKEAVRSIPRRGIGYGLLHYGSGEPSPAPIGFNYLGRLGGETGGLEVRFGSVADPAMAVLHALEINAAVEETSDGPVLRAEWTWAPGRLDTDTVTGLANSWRIALEAFAAHHTDPTGAGRTPSDFPLANLTAPELDRIEGEFGEPSDVLPALPLQAGLLFHTLYQRSTDAAEDPYVVQLVLELEGDLDEQRLERAARELLHRHPHLGSAFAVEGLDRIVAVVRHGIETPWRTVDLTGQPTSGQHRTLERELAAERDRIDPGIAPPLAFCLIRLAPSRWRLAFTHHHVLLDGWSVANVLRETILSYTGADLPAAPPFHDYLTWRADRDHAAARVAWAAALENCAPTRVSHAGRAGWTEPPHVHELTLPDHLSARLLHLATGTGLTLNTLVSTAWALVLGHATGSEDVVFGTTVSVRPPDLDAERMVGLMINTVPVRVRLRPGDTLADLAATVQAGRAALYEHEHLGLDEIEDVAGSTELFDTSVVFENYPLEVDDLGPGSGLRVDMADVRDRPHYPVALVVVPRDGQLTFRLSIRPKQVAWFGDADLWWDRFRAACTALAHHPDRTIASTDLLPEHIRAEVMNWSRGPVTDRETRSIGEVFESVAARQLDHVAIRAGSRELTYRQLRAEVHDLANRLARHGVGMGSAVGVALDRSPDVPIAFLAIVRLGAYIVPIDQRFPPERRRELLRHTDSRLMLDPGTLADLRRAEPAPDTDRAVPISATACLWFTSGSTGAPKGAAVTHRNILTRIRDRSCAGDPYDRILFHSPHSWDFATYEVWLPLLTGRSMVIAPAGDLTPADYTRMLREDGVTAAALGTGLFDLLSAECTHELAGLRRVLVGGAALPADAVTRLREVNPEIPVTNIFGPVEATFYATTHPIPPREHPAGPVPIGRPVDNSAAYVMDAMLRPCAPMVVGEIYLSGSGLAEGYQNQPTRSAERFVADPFGPPGARMYRTGDLGRWDAQGTLHFHGRIDRQIKMSGFRIEPAEVETALRQRPEITAAAVTTRPGPAGTALIAYVVSAEPIDSGALRADLVERLPRYLVPAAIVRLDDLPLTPTGKVDFAALPAPATATAGPVRSMRQQILADLFAEALGLAEVTVGDDFFLLGGNSLSAIRLVGRIRSALRCSVSVHDLFEAPTVTALERRLSGRASDHARPVRAWSPRPAVLPLSAAQQRFWTVNYLEAGRPDYVIATAIEVDGPLDDDALRTAIGDVLARHEVLRTVLPYTETGPVQQIVPAESIRITLPATDVEDIDAAIAAEMSGGFDLRTSLPVRGKLFRVDPQQHVVFAMFHHVAVDGASIAILHRDLVLAYSARLNGKPPEWDSPATQYADYALALRDRLGDESDPGSVLADQGRHWRAILADLPEELPLPHARPRAQLTDRAAAAMPIIIQDPDYTAIARAARACDASTYTLVHAALAATLGTVSGGHDIPIGVVVSGRDTDDLDSVVGYLVDLVVVRTDTASTGPALVRTVRDALLTAFDNKDYPFDRLVDALAPPRIPHRHPLVQTAITYQVAAHPPAQFPGANTRLRPIHTHTTEFDLLLELTEDPARGTISGEFVYPAQLFAPATIEHLLATFHNRLSALCEDVAATGDRDRPAIRE